MNAKPGGFLERGCRREGEEEGKEEGKEEEEVEAGRKEEMKLVPGDPDIPDPADLGEGILDVKPKDGG